ncbi:SIS domain-containing protein [Dehalococcoidia bacterium]|nr:SIS domain-containing protein [Dehalococcoidia bacterium]
MNNLEKIFSESRSGGDYARRYASYMSELLTSLNWQAIEGIIEVFQTVRANGKTIFFAGNGGSAATCSHFAEDLVYGTMVEGAEPFKALSLTDNVAYITALGNDEGYENIFVGQMKNLFKQGDVIVGISGSGNSPNVVKAIEYANSKGVSPSE